MKKYVLLAEDDRDLRGFLTEALEMSGAHVIGTVDGEEALAKLAEMSFDIVITDHRMPRLDGLGFVRALRERAFAGRIVVISGVLSEQESDAYEALQVDRVLMKPLTLAQLIGLLRDEAVSLDLENVARE